MVSPRAPASRPASRTPEAVLRAGLAKLKLALPEAAVAQLMQFLGELEKWNAAYNLTAVRDPVEMVTRHLLDSLAVLPVLETQLKAGEALLDVGAGAGLPCIPLAIARPQWAITGLDSNGKKARFMRHAQRALGLTNFQVAEGRVEDQRGEYRVVTSRAFASLHDFVFLTRHLLARDGVWVAMKGKLADEERAQLPPDVTLFACQALTVPGLHEDRHAILLCPKP